MTPGHDGKRTACAGCDCLSHRHLARAAIVTDRDEGEGAFGHLDLFAAAAKKHQTETKASQ